jgi:ribosomal protein S24E
MDLKIIRKQDNPLLSRTEIQAESSFFNESTPKKEDIKKKISTMEKADEKLVVIKNICNDFGTGKADVLTYVYKSEEELKKTEPKKKEKKEPKEKKEAKPEEATKEESKEEAKEAPKEESKKEEAPKEKAKEAPKEEAKKE